MDMAYPPDRLPVLIGLAEREQPPLRITVGKQAERTGANTAASVAGVHFNHVDLHEVGRFADADIVARSCLVDHFDTRNLDAVLADNC